MMSTYPWAGPSRQISPRFGLAYQLGDKAVLHFSYGHFFQMPPFYALYQNHSFLVAPSDYSTTMGNSLLKPEKTVTYEIGLWQELTRQSGLEVSLFYRDIYNLLSTKIISTYNQIEYGLFSNKDYGNVRGLEVKFNYSDRRFYVNINYTLQYTRGNADYPQQAFDRAGNSMDPVNRFIPMSWDQRHTFNMTVGYSRRNVDVSATGYYNSGVPYTFSPLGESVLSRINLYPNNDYQPATYQVDMQAHYIVPLAKGVEMRFDLTIYNLFDRLNEVVVNSRTGRAYTDVIQETDLAGHRSDFNTYEDRIRDPSMYSPPRQIKVGMTVQF
jgi:outer membrane receptor protein involved in Fe transport